MDQHTVENTNDFTRDWVASSRFLFYLKLACILALVVGGSYALFTHRYKGKPKVAVPESSLYDPKYK
ncbi:hypothetical protein [Chitinophaga barathri]|uniref:Uncharacterized protein n=1 Tax=Chitinophaga barathri TaxID=1647451 RepID=A0A3N4MCC1_9BACT|nr:hypothetical protein [Chitinophaga barathri]RPD41341.1 hypothetical protein EG028_08450 [Chitinophaga barathri]